jgi:UPF0755 protein
MWSNVLLNKIVGLFLSSCVAMIVAFYLVLQYQMSQPLALPHQQLLTIVQGESINRLAQQLKQRRLISTTFWLKSYVKIYPKYTDIKQGTYQLTANANLIQLLQQLQQGREHQFQLTFVEGSTFNEWLAQLQQTPEINYNLHELSTAQIAERLAIAQATPEGWLFPDTYAFTAGTTALSILATAHAKMKQELMQAWQQRQLELPINTAYQALILASIIEKETGQVDEQALISAVFHNRLRKRMRLQTDPTVIYGLGEQYQGDIKRIHLKQYTPYNTYKIKGLPPTPIAMPGKSALLASVQPAADNFLYFVSQGNGRHVFSDNITDHNNAVVRYQLKK